jgi:Neurotransmitter-gated ion-channel ligand binding domain
MRRWWALLALCLTCGLVLAQTPRGGAQPAGSEEHVLGDAEGQADVQGQAPSGGPTVVRVGLRVHQITDIDQKAERFGAVGDIQMEFTDPKLAFVPQECECEVKILRPAQLEQLAQKVGTTWPEYYLFNRQDRVFYDAQVAEIRADGKVRYFERFSATFQAPDFDFRRYPFDKQLFFVRVLSYSPDSEYVYEHLDDWSGLGAQLGEEEWILSGFRPTVTTTDDSHSMISFAFGGERHITYYLLRIFLPIGIIILVSWVIFFLRDYSKRVDISMTVLLLLVAFNFVISGDLPRLGYLSFLDAILASAFVVTGLIVIMNVYLRRLETKDRTDWARTIDSYVLWCYPILYALGVGAVVIFFFV